MAALDMLKEPSLRGTLVVLVVATTAILVLRRLVSGNQRVPTGAKPLPGPKGWPIVGNALDIPKSHAWFKFKEWADEYGPIYQAEAFGTTLVIISKESIANELLGLRGANYSDRPALHMTRLITDGGFLGAIGWTDYWRRARKFAQTMLSTSVVQQSVHKQTTEARQMVIDLAQEPSKYAYWLERAGVMTSVKQIYGLTVDRGPAEEEHVHQICDYMHEIDRTASPGMYLVEFIPLLMYLPSWLAPFKREARRIAKRHWEYLFPLLQQQEDKYKRRVPESPESYARRYLASPQDWKLSEREMVWTLSSIYGGASGTSSTAMQSIILNTCLFPEWQDRMQREIDDAVGDSQLPSYNDFSRLPIVRAVIKETLRWRPVLSGGFPHAVIKDDVFEGYHIPKGAVVIPNQWAILRDAELYPEPDSFRPERWLEPSYPTYQEPLTKYPNLKRFAGFGHGRRICPGLEVAEQALFLEVASLYWACNIRRGKCTSGEEIEIPWYDYTGVSISCPRKFPFTVEEHCEGRLKMMKEAVTTDHAREMVEQREKKQ